MSESAAFKSHVSSQNFTFNLWNIDVKKSHILQSRCTNVPPCESLESQSSGSLILCDFCKYAIFNAYYFSVYLDFAF